MQEIHYLSESEEIDVDGPAIAVEDRDTLANAIRRKLAAQILAGEFRSQTRLDETEVAKRFCVSRTPVREALRQLDAAGLVELRPRLGAIVVPVDRERIGHAFEAAAELEAVAAFWAASRAQLFERKKLEKIYLENEKAQMDEDSERFATTNRHFHDHIGSMARNPILANAVAAVRVRTAPFQKAQYASAERMRALQKDHRKIFEAICFQDTENARLFMKQHILKSSFSALEEGQLTAFEELSAKQ